MLVPPLGIVAFGEVSKALHKTYGVLRAIKIMAKDHMSPEEHNRLLNEVNIMQNMVLVKFECIGSSPCNQNI